MIPRAATFRLLMAAALAVPALAMLAMILAFSVDIPYWDEWETPGMLYEQMAEGAVRPEEWTRFHNEARIPIPKMVYALVGRTAGWRVRGFMVAGWLLALFTGGLVVRRLPFRLSSRRGVSLAAAAAMALLLFTPAQIENQLWGFQWILFIPALLLAASHEVRQLRLHPVLTAGLCALLAFVATFSFANGMLCWLLGFPFGAWWLSRSWAFRPRLRQPEVAGSLLYGTAAAISIALYFHGYVKPGYHPPLSDALLHPGRGALYFLTWLGAPYLPLSAPATQAAWFGAGIALLAAAAFFHAARTLVRRRDPADIAPLQPWIEWMAYGLASGLITTLGRSGFGIAQASSSRYASFAVWVVIGSAGLVASLPPRAGSASAARPPVRSWGIVLAALLLAVLSWRDRLPAFEARRSQQLQNLLTLRLAPHAPRNPLWPDLFISDIRPRLLHLHRAGFFRFDLVGDWLPGKLLQPDGDGAGWFHLDREPNGRLHVHGWAMLPPTGASADAVLLCRRTGEGDWAVVTGLRVQFERPDVVSALDNNQLLRSGFSRRFDNLPAGPEETYAMFVLDETEQRVYRLEGNSTPPDGRSPAERNSP